MGIAPADAVHHNELPTMNGVASFFQCDTLKASRYRHWHLSGMHSRDPVQDMNAWAARLVGPVDLVSTALGLVGHSRPHVYTCMYTCINTAIPGGWRVGSFYDEAKLQGMEDASEGWKRMRKPDEEVSEVGRGCVYYVQRETPCRWRSRAYGLCYQTG
jgi:hypothetical protein